MTLPRDDKGRFVPVDCPDPHCGARRAAIEECAKCLETFTVTISEGRRRTISATIFADDWLDAAKQLHSILYQQSCVETQARPLSRFSKIEMRGPR